MSVRQFLRQSAMQWPTRHYLLVFGISLFLLSGCSGSTQSGAELTIEPKVTPQPARVGLATIDFKLKDGSGKPISGAHAALEANMSHPGMAPVFADAKEYAPGEYSCPIEFSMAGDWSILVRITLSNGQKLKREFEVKGVRPD